MKAEYSTERTVTTEYYFRRNRLKTNRSTSVRNAVRNCVDYMHTNQYKASIAVVFDQVAGKQYAVITRNLVGKITIVFDGEQEAK